MQKQYNEAVVYLPDDDHIRLKHAVEVMFMEKDDSTAHQRSTSKTRTYTLKTAHTNKILTEVFHYFPQSFQQNIVILTLNYTVAISLHILSHSLSFSCLTYSPRNGQHY